MSILATTLLIVVGAMLMVSGDKIRDHCKPEICTPCFSRKVKCTTTIKSEVIPQYLDATITSLTLTFEGGGDTVQLRRSDVLRYKNLTVIKLSGDLSEISADALMPLPNLTTFELSKTQITSLPNNLFLQNKKLTSVTFLNNLFHKIPLNIFPPGLVSVTCFTFSGNKNTTLPCLNDSISLPARFHDFRRLSKLVIENNNFVNHTCSNMTEKFFHSVERVKILSVAGSKFPGKLENSIGLLKDLVHLDASDLEPYKLCPAIAQNLFDNLPKSMSFKLDIHNWEQSQKVETRCTVTPETLQSLAKLSKLNTLSFRFCDGMFGATLKGAVLPWMRNLRRLDIEYCRISSIEFNALERVPKLEELSLSGNPLGPIDLHLVAQPLINLRKLDLDNAEIRSDENLVYENPNLLCDFPNLNALHFDYNSLTRLPNFRSKLSFCGLHNYPSLKHFSAINNMLRLFVSSSPDDPNNLCIIFPKLSQLSLTNNMLNQLSGLELCTNLFSLTLAHNKLFYYGETRLASDLTKILQNLTHMEKLDLGYNSVRTLDQELLSKMPNLTSITLNNNNLEQLNGTQFKGNTKLQYICLSYNYLQFLPPNIFTGLTKLKAVDLGGNKLTALSADFLNVASKLPALNFLSLSDNPYICGCDKTFKNWLHGNALEKASVVYLTCGNPHSFKGKLIYDYQENFWECHLKNAIIISGSISAGFLLTLAIALPCYKYRWYIRHARMVWKAFNGNLKLIKWEQICPFDAYVSFNPKSLEDCEWVAQELVPAIEGIETSDAGNFSHTLKSTKKLRLFLECRDSLSGTNRFTERAIALEKCKRILIVVSNLYLKSADCLSEADLTGLQMHGTKFYQPNRVMLLIREELNEEILKPPMSSLLLGKTLKVENRQQKKNAMWKKIRQFLLEPLYIASNPDDIPSEDSNPQASERELESTESTPLLYGQS